MHNNQDKRNKKMLPAVKNILTANNLIHRAQQRLDRSRSKQNNQNRRQIRQIQNIQHHKTVQPRLRNIGTQNLRVVNENNPNNQIIKVLNQQQPDTIAIHVNIQNNTNFSDIKKQKIAVSHLTQKHKKEDSKDRKKELAHKFKSEIIPNNKNNFEQFECNEQLQLTLPSNNLPNNKLQRKISQKKPLISYPEKHPNVSHINQKQYQQQCMITKSPKVIPSQEIKQFENTQITINIEAETQMLLNINQQQKNYTVDPSYIEKKQKNFTWIMRAILIDWMMHVNSEFALKRQTFHVAVTLTDNFMAKTPNLPKSDFQLVGAAAMFIASKLEQFQPLSSKQFAKSTNGRYNALMIKQMEQRICKNLKFQLNPPTIYMWANRYMSQWDRYLQDTQTGQNHPLFKRFKKCQKFYFKNTSDESYKNFRVIMQLLDCSLLDVQTYQYRPQILVCSFMYLVLGKQLNGFKNKEISTDFPRSSLYLLDEQNLYNDYFRSFVEQSFRYLLVDLLPTVQYSATYFKLPMILDPPSCKIEQENGDEFAFEQYCSFQTYNSKQLQIIKKRQRGIYEYQYE